MRRRFPRKQKLVPDKSLLPFLFIDFVFALDLSHLSPSPFSYTTYHNAFLLYHLFLVLCIILGIIISNADNACIVTSPVANQDMKKRTEIIRFVFVSFGADNRTCSERSERNSISEQVYLQSVAPAAQRAGANKRSAVCRQNVVLFQVRCRMKKDNPFGLSFFGADNRT